ncbi:MAG: hypothetical protein RBT63_09065 [Bdellovibrionales bacterium]|jgi:hypothetical protein|nr:hypothetical protein [Bdellovibrionales bacterium]
MIHEPSSLELVLDLKRTDAQTPFGTQFRENFKAADRRSDLFYLGRFIGDWSHELRTMGFTNLIDVVTNGAQSQDSDYRDRAEAFAKLGNYTEHNTKYFQHFGAELPSFAHRMVQASGLEDTTVSLIRQDPGNILPWHQDHFYQLKRKLADKGIDPKSARIWRFVVFLEDWTSGHYFQVEDTPCVKWRRGDIVTFMPQAFHLSSNVGTAPKFTLQITGLETQNCLLFKTETEFQI